MFHENSPKLPRKHPRFLKVIIVARISTDKQNEKSLDDQKAYCLERLNQEFDCQIEIKFIHSRDSGEYLDRAELFQLECLIESGEWDIVITEDLGRICRRSHSLTICEMCEDAGTRLIAINDHIDMAEDGWQLCSYFAAFRHEQYNRDTALRIRRSQQNRFLHGGVLPRPFWGYLGWATASNDSELRKDPDAELIIVEAFRRLEDGATFAEIADWFNDLGVPTGPCCRKKKWSTMSVQRFVRNTMLKGIRTRNRTRSVRLNKTGRRQSTAVNPDQWLRREVPHLAYFDAAYYDHVLQILRERNKDVGRPRSGVRNSRSGISTKRTLWPLQHAKCAICGWPAWRAGTYEERVACCSGALNYRCWNGMMFQIDKTQKWILDALLARLGQLADFDVVVKARLEEAQRKTDAAEERRDLERRVSRLEAEARNLVEAVSLGGNIPELVEKLRTTQARLEEARYRKDQFEKAQARGPVEIPSQENLFALVSETMQQAINQDDQACRLLSRILAKVTLQPVVLCDGGAVELQAIVELDISAALTAFTGCEIDLGPEREILTVNLFDTPAYVQHAERLGTVEARGEQVLDVAQTLGISFSTAALARRLYRRMQDLDLTNPYLRIDAPPTRGWRCRRHKHPRYRFEPRPTDETPPDAA